MTDEYHAMSIDHQVKQSRRVKALEAENGRLRARVDALLTAAHAVVTRWDTPLWKDVPATAAYINELRRAIEGLGK